MVAAAKGSLEMINLVLMNKTVDIEVKNESGVNAFWIACNYGHGGVMRKLAELGINIFCFNEQRINSLHLAVTKDHLSIV